MRKYEPWYQITTLDQLLIQPFVYLGKTGRTIPRGWFRNWQLWYAQKAIREWNLWAPTAITRKEEGVK